MSYRTYEQWIKKGRHVKKGEKSVGKLEDGTALFSKKQTKVISNTHHNDYYTGNTQCYDDEQEYGGNIGLPGQW